MLHSDLLLDGGHRVTVPVHPDEAVSVLAQERGRLPRPFVEFPNVRADLPPYRVAADSVVAVRPVVVHA